MPVTHPHPPLHGTLAPAAELLHAGPRPRNPNAGHRTPPRPPHTPPAPVLLPPCLCPAPVLLSSEPLLQCPPSSSALGPIPETLAPATELLRGHCPHVRPRPPPQSPSTHRAPSSEHRQALATTSSLGTCSPRPRYDEESSNSAVNLVFKSLAGGVHLSAGPARQRHENRGGSLLDAESAELADGGVTGDEEGTSVFAMTSRTD
ncbi:classical arabinogalactan protein 9-like [Miscanthus floridulus]|uniref:classical arabinogalactan protein 9-like n=1 Tax=Miscanthus floridulus TaxID=154761 RepID=UPI003458BA8F